MRYQQTPQHGGSGEALPTGAQPPQQMELPAIPLPPFAPRWPSLRSIEYTALELFLAGEFVNVERFRQLTQSTKLPVAVGRLKHRMGWPIEKFTAPEPSRRNRNRYAGVWFLPQRYIEQAKAARAAQGENA